MNQRKKIAYISGTRADFGLMTPVLQAIRKSEKLSLQVYVTGMHLSSTFGETVNEVLLLFPDAKRIEATIQGDGKEAQAEFAGALLPKVVSALTKDRPDFVILLGDRVEMLVVATACLYLGIPTGHLHGGERTGNVDEVARHAISKMASLHFTTTEDSAERLKKMGEDPWRVHIVGAPALDTITRRELPTREEICTKLELNPKKQFILVVQHGVSEEAREAGHQMVEILSAVNSVGLPMVIIYPNADPGSESIIVEIEKERKNPHTRILKSIPHTDFLALERETAVWVGNSSGALIESSSFGTPVVNVGTRQKGRVRGENVIDAPPEKEAIQSALQKSLHDEVYLARLKHIKNPWGDGHTGEKVATILEKFDTIPNLLSKQITY